MSTNRLVDILTFAKVTTAAPVIPGIDPELAVELVIALDRMNDNLEYHVDAKGVAYRQAPYMDVIANMATPISPNLFGRIARQLGLSSKRMAGGYHVLWNKDQLHILANYYLMELEAK